MSRAVRAIAIGCLAVLAVACGAGPAKPAPDSVTLQLKWVHQAQFAGFYLAQEQGYYADENLAVTLAPGGVGINPVQRVLDGQADFGVEAPETILTQRGLGRPIVAVASIYRRSPLVYVTRVGSGIKGPTDFPGHSVAVLGATVDAQIQLTAMLTRLGLDPHQMKWVDYSYDYGPFFKGDVDITCSISNGGLIRIRQKGYQVNLIWPSDYGIHVYSDTLFGTDRFVAERPDVALRFVRASLRGWRRAVEDPTAAVTATLRYAKEADVDLQTRMMDASVPLVHTGEDQIGWMKSEIWRGAYEMLQAGGVITQPVDVDKVYTMKFLHQIYGDAP
jgi:NitT/TauT family transport system substrate-binding protein